MEHSLLLARLFGIVFIVVYGGLLFNYKFYKRIIEDIPYQPLILFLSGLIALISGLLVIEFHSIWTLDWKGLITLLGWILMINGIIRIIFPEQSLKMAHKFIGHTRLIYTTAIFMLIIGIYLTYVGFNT